MARDERLPVWGRRGADGPFEPVPPEHWRDYRISIVSVLDDRDRSACKSEPAELQASSLEVYCDLGTSREHVEVLWPPKGWLRS